MSADFYWANVPPQEAPIEEWVERFHRDGYLFLENVLPSELCEELKVDRDRALEEQGGDVSGSIHLHHRMFEKSKANLSLFDLEPIVTFAERLIADTVHVIHNNSFKVYPGSQGISTWHQDDAPHYLVTHGEPPTNVRLPVLLFTANYYLTDVTSVENGPTQVIPRSHLIGQRCPPNMTGTKWEESIISTLGKAGSLIMFNNQVWHRGSPNSTDVTRYITQVSYARRLVGHKYHPFMNYQMPEEAYRDANPRLKRLLGFLPSGAYG